MITKMWEIHLGISSICDVVIFGRDCIGTGSMMGGLHDRMCNGLGRDRGSHNHTPGCQQRVDLLDIDLGDLWRRVGS